MVKLKHLKEARCVLVLYFWHQISRINSEMAYWTCQATWYTHGNNKSVQTVPSGRKVLDESKTNGFQNELHSEDGCENIVAYFQSLCKLRLLVKMNVFKNLNNIERHKLNLHNYSTFWKHSLSQHQDYGSSAKNLLETYKRNTFWFWAW